MLTIAPDAMHLVPKGHRKGYELAWVDLVSGDAALATALNASLARGPKPDTEKNANALIKPKATRIAPQAFKAVTPASGAVGTTLRRATS
jgi:hypothetical protein